jgi:acetyltransferase-like isoleucine patch superfamily enzyme
MINPKSKYYQIPGDSLLSNLNVKIEDPKMHGTYGDGSFSLKDFRKIGENVIFEKGVLVFHPENISIGNNVYIGHNAILKGYYKNEMVIGDHTWIGQGCFLHSGGGLEIGKAVGIGPMVKVITSVHREDDFSKPLIFCDLEFMKVIIEDECDIGGGAIILPGVKIGVGSIIGAGSVVNKDVEPYCVVAGVPAKVLRRRSK